MPRCLCAIFVALLMKFGNEARSTYRRTLIVTAILLRRISLLGVAAIAIAKSALNFSSSSDLSSVA